MFNESNNYILNKRISEINSNFNNLKNVKNDILKAVNLCKKTLPKNRIFFCGNGGSASDAMHISAELLGKYMKDRKALPAICLNSNVSAMTAIANDYNYNKIFARQLEGLGKTGDLVFAISTSGTSKNILEVLKKAKKMKLNSILLTGKNNKKFNVDLCIKAPAKRVDRIQELHITILHLICELVEFKF